jgi:amino acid permease
LLLTFWIVTLITGLILCGLIIDLGGGPDHKRLGFNVSKSSEYSFQRPDHDV